VILSGVSQETDVTDVSPAESGGLSTLPKVLPALHQTFWYLLGVQSENQMITPVTVYVQIPRPQSLWPKT
jgi:hypothetical protein